MCRAGPVRRAMSSSSSTRHCSQCWRIARRRGPCRGRAGGRGGPRPRRAAPTWAAIAGDQQPTPSSTSRPPGSTGWSSAQPSASQSQRRQRLDRPLRSGARSARRPSQRGPGARASPASSSSQCTTSASSASEVGDRRRQGGLARPGRSVDAHQPAGAERRGSGETRVRRRCARPHGVGRSASEGTVAAAVGRHDLGDRLAADQVHVADVLEELARLGVPEPHQVADPRAARPGGR